MDEQQGHEYVYPPEQQFSPSQYNLLQPHSSQEEQTKQSLQLNTLVYADLGSRSFQRQKAVVFDTFKLDDDRVEYAQVQINKLLTRSKEEQEPVTENLSYADDLLNLDSLLIQLKSEVSPNWYSFGKALGVDEKVLERCIQYPPEESIVEVCDNWLREHSGKPTWREVAEALKKINCQQLAFEIEKVYLTGRLPREVKIDDEDDIFCDDVPPPLPAKMSL